MDKALKQAKPQLQVSAKDGKVIIIGNQEGLDLLARIVSVASTTPYADAAVGPDGRGICHLCHAVFAARCPGARARG